MLYKVTPMMEPEPEKKPREAGAPRKRRATAIYDRDGNEVLISLMCLKCRTVKPLAQFGLRKMADGAIRNQPWCRPCRSGAGTHKKKGEAPETVMTPAEAERAPIPVEEETGPVLLADAPESSTLSQPEPILPELATFPPLELSEASSSELSETEAQPETEAQLSSGQTAESSELLSEPAQADPEVRDEREVAHVIGPLYPN